MILKRLKLKNYLQHAAVDVPIDGTLIAVVGRNGAGKSNLLGSIQFALTGEQPGYAKGELLSWGASEGSVVLEFEHNGSTGTIERSVTGTGASFTYNGISVKGITQVAAAIKEHIGVDKDLSKQIVFVRQAEIDSILFTDPRVRELSFQKMMGIGDVAKIYDSLGKKLSSLERPADYDLRIDEGRTHLSVLSDRMTGLTSRINGMLAALDAKPAVADMRKTMSSVKAATRGLDDYAAHLAAVGRINAAIAKCEVEIAKVGTFDETEVQKLDAELARLGQLKSGAAALSIAQTTFETAERKLQALGDCPHTEAEFREAESDAAKKTATVEKLSGEMGLYSMLKRGLATATLDSCPVCGSALSDPGAATAHVTTAVGELEKSLAEATTLAVQAGSKARSMDNAIRMYAKSRAEAETLHARAKGDIENLAPVAASVAECGGYDGLCARMGAITTTLNDLRAKIIQYTSLNGTLTAEKRHLVEAVPARDAAADVVFSLLGWSPVGAMPDVLAAKRAELMAQTDCLAKAIDEQTALTTEIAKLDGARTELKNAMENLAKTIDELVEKKASQAGRDAAVSTLGNVRDWFHYSNGPHVMSSMVLGALTSDVNKFLSQFTAPFTVEPMDTALGFKCNFTDGRKVPDSPPGAEKLSGGQKIQLAVAFRFAAYCMFAGKLGLLSLDEPTAYLDDQNIGRFGDLLQQIKTVAKDMNIQVLMATHERSVMPFMDTIIDLGT